MNDTLMTISDREFEQMRQLIYERFGINLTEQKRFLPVGRLQKMAQGTAASFSGLFHSPKTGLLLHIKQKDKTSGLHLNSRGVYYPGFIKTTEKDWAGSLRFWGRIG